VEVTRSLVRHFDDISQAKGMSHPERLVDRLSATLFAAESAKENVRTPTTDARAIGSCPRCVDKFEIKNRRTTVGVITFSAKKRNRLAFGGTILYERFLVRVSRQSPVRRVFPRTVV
jgi:hypothetical protein